MDTVGVQAAIFTAAGILLVASVAARIGVPAHIDDVQEVAA
jgi:hypothetical protein